MWYYCAVFACVTDVLCGTTVLFLRVSLTCYVVLLYCFRVSLTCYVVLLCCFRVCHCPAMWYYCMFPHQESHSPRCVYWHRTAHNTCCEWVSDGCVVLQTNKLFTTCACHHLTHFGLTMVGFYINIDIDICMYIHTHTHIYIYIYIYTHTHTHTYICIYIYIHTYTHTYIHTHTYIYIYVYIYIYTHILLLLLFQGKSVWKLLLIT